MSARLLRCGVAALLLLTVSCADLLGLEEAGTPAVKAGAGASSAGSSTDFGDSQGVAGSPSQSGGNAGQGGADGLEGGAPTELQPGLTDLQLSEGVLEPAFDPTRTEPYQLKVGLSVAALRITPIAVDRRAIVLVNAAEVASGEASPPLPLELGSEGSIAVVADSGTPEEKTYTVKVERATGLFQEAYLKASSARSGDHFGASIALSQGTLAVGAPLEDGSGFGVNPDPSGNEGDNSGAVFVFVKSDSSWTQQAYLKASNPRPFDGFGSAVALSGDVLVVGAPGESSSAKTVDGEMNDASAAASGAAYVFRRVAGHWAQSAYLKASDSSASSLFGSSVAVTAGTIVVGAPGHTPTAILDQAGAAYVFDSLAQGWVESQRLTASYPGARDRFGSSVAISGKRLVVGAPGEETKDGTINGSETGDNAYAVGAAHVFQRDKQGFQRTAFLKASNARAEAFFGSAVAIDGELVAVGSPGESSSATGVDGQQADAEAPNSGAVYLFANTGSKTSWQQQAYVKASNAELGDAFGSAVALDHGVLAVAASGEDSSATGIQGEQANEDAERSGAVYLFAKAGDDWAEQAYVKASNTDASDELGSAVAVADGELALGAEFESSAHPDNPDDDTADASGAVYVRSLLALPPETGVGARGLTSLTLDDSPVELVPGTFDYRVDAEPGTTSVDLVAVGADPNAEISVTNQLGELFDTSGPIELQPGDNRFTLHVRSSRGEYVSYTLDVRVPIAVTEEDSPGQLDVWEGLLWNDVPRNNLALDTFGDTLVVGVPFDDRPRSGSSDYATTQDTGVVYVFLRTELGWKQQAQLKASNASAANLFGYSVALDHDTLVVGAPGEASQTRGIDGDQSQDAISGVETGAAYVFSRTEGKWEQRTYLKAFNAMSNARFGESVDCDGDRIVVGALRESSSAVGVDGDGFAVPGAGSSGAAYVYARDADSWSLDAYLKPTNTASSQFFGTRVALHADTIAVTATDENGGSSTINGDQFLGGGMFSGAVYTYVHRGHAWEPEAYIKAPNYHADVDFGRSLALGEDILVVGASGDQSRSRYVDGDEFDAVGATWYHYNLDASISGHGAVYVFERDATTGWHKAAYLKASNSDGQDAFGMSVSLSGDYLAVGAPGSNGADSDTPDDGTTQQSGAAYLFHRSALGWSQAAFVKPQTPTSGAGFGCYVTLDPMVAGRLAVSNCRQEGPPFEPEPFGKAAVFQF